MPKVRLKEFAYNSVKEKILNCEYEPNSFLNEDILCEEMNMSRTPVRDALSRLEQEQLIRIVPQKGFFIAPLSINEIHMVFEGRLLIEPYIIRNYCTHLPEELLEQMWDCLKEEDKSIIENTQNTYQLDNEFHGCLIRQCSNRYLVRLYSELHAQNSRLRVLSARSSENRLSNTIEEHRKILIELTRHNPEQAALYMEEHLHRSRESAFYSFMNSGLSL